MQPDVQAYQVHLQLFRKMLHAAHAALTEPVSGDREDLHRELASLADDAPEWMSMRDRLYLALVAADDAMALTTPPSQAPFAQAPSAQAPATPQATSSEPTDRPRPEPASGSTTQSRPSAPPDPRRRPSTSGSVRAQEIIIPNPSELGR